MSKIDRYKLLGWKSTKGATLYGVTLEERDARIRAAFAQRAANFRKEA